MNAAILGASGYVGGELLRLIDAHPAMSRADVRRVDRGPAARRAPSASALAYPDARFDAVGAGGARRQRRGVRRSAPWRNPAAGRRSGRHRREDRRPGRRLPPRQRQGYQLWYGEPHRRPDLIASSSTACPNSTATPSPRHARRRAGLLPDRGQPGAAAADRRGRGRDRRDHRRRRLGRQRRGPPANDGTHFCAVDGSFRAYGLTRHRHTAEMEMVAGAKCCSPRT